LPTSAERTVAGDAPMNFEYWRHSATGEELVARGEQQVACMQREGEQVVPIPVPAQLREALREYARD
jgi:enediyne biosynthesis thioesterase